MHADAASDGGHPEPQRTGGAFSLTLGPPPSTPPPEGVATRCAGASGHVLTCRVIRIVWELCMHAASDGGHPEQQKTGGAFSLTLGPPPLYPPPGGRGDAMRWNLRACPDMQSYQKSMQV